MEIGGTGETGTTRMQENQLDEAYEPSNQVAKLNPDDLVYEFQLLQEVNPEIECEDLKELNDKVFKVKNSSQSIILKDITEKSFSIMYLDNLNVLNTITFNKVKK